MLFRTAAIAALILASPPAASAADRAPTPEERTAIENALKGQGFTAWRGIEFDDGKWEVDGAVHADGKEYQVDLAPSTYAIVKKERD
ncbi:MULTISPECIES: PepSY domain-containing protein [Rhodomicrobium]|uniref:PepSY domain-containing protein n=1 Tax=Rhodomicrobium TaxID=1068 RepID=UPI000B4B9A8A|nr:MULTISPECIES: PepSY domain-containing protein [Rhodomicrobium]